MKIAAFITFVLSAWLTYGANSLHYKDPAHYGPALAWVLFAIALVSGVALVLIKPKAERTATARR
jgi:hypothetical protein